MKRKLSGLIICFALVVSGVFAIAIYGMTDSNIYISSTEALVSAITNAKGKESIVLKKDIVLDQSLNITGEVTINLNGHKISNTEDIWSTANANWSLFSVQEGGNLTLKGKGIVEAKENDCYAVDVKGGMVTIEDGTFIGNVSSVYVHSGTAVIKGGTFSIKQLSTFGDHKRRFKNDFR